MKITPRQWHRFSLVFVNLWGAAIIATLLIVMPDMVVSILTNPTLLPPFTSFLTRLVFVGPFLMLISFNVAVIRKCRRNQGCRAPECPICSSKDVSFRAETSVMSLHKSRLATNLTLWGGLGAVIAALTRDILPASWQLSPYVFAVPVLGILIQAFSLGLTAKQIGQARKRSDGLISWMCETCKNEWEGLERPAESVPAAPAPSSVRLL